VTLAQMLQPPAPHSPSTPRPRTLDVQLAR